MTALVPLRRVERYQIFEEGKSEARRTGGHYCLCPYDRKDKAEIWHRGFAEGMQNVVARRIVCAAIRASDGRLLLGIRHYSHDMHDQINAREDGEKFAHRHDEDQGFVDQHGVFMSREEAYAVAGRAGQIIYPVDCGNGLDGPKLYSEGLY